MSRWYARHDGGRNPGATEDDHGLGSPAAVADPAVRSIRDHIRLGNS